MVAVICSFVNKSHDVNRIILNKSKIISGKNIAAKIIATILLIYTKISFTILDDPSI